MTFSSNEFLQGLWEGTNNDWVKWIHRNLSDNHCQECLMLDNCWFLRSKSPTWPHHPFCHCLLEPISYDLVSKNAISKSDYRKFDIYLFNAEGRYTDTKKILFESWGYTIDDAKWLQSEIEKQALQKYKKGVYKLGLLDKYGQRISIGITLPRKMEKVRFLLIQVGW